MRPQSLCLEDNVGTKPIGKYMPCGRKQIRAFIQTMDMCCGQPVGREMTREECDLGIYACIPEYFLAALRT